MTFIRSLSVSSNAYSSGSSGRLTHTFRQLRKCMTLACNLWFARVVSPWEVFGVQRRARFGEEGRVKVRVGKSQRPVCRSPRRSKKVNDPGISRRMET